MNDLTSSCECKVEKSVMIDPLPKAVSFGRFAVDAALRGVATESVCFCLSTRVK